MKTDDKELICNSKTDSFWGAGPDGKGLNHIGRIWMKLRQEEMERNKTIDRCIDAVLGEIMDEEARKPPGCCR